MSKIKNILFTLLSIAAIAILSSWGTDGHRKINQHEAASLPHSMQFLKASWAIILAEHASDADARKDWDPSEVPKHYLNIDGYPEFLQTGKM